jgi:metal transporter CNNM
MKTSYYRDVNDLEKEEVDIVTGALAYKEKTVRSVMTPLNDAYLLSIKTVLDFETISEIRDQVPCGFPNYKCPSKY